jgi:hypothetical protein
VTKEELKNIMETDYEDVLSSLKEDHLQQRVDQSHH